MAKKSRLKMALAEQKGTDFEKLKIKRKQRAQKKEKKKLGGEVNGDKKPATEDDWEDLDNEDEAGGAGLDEEVSEEGENGVMQACSFAIFDESTSKSYVEHRLRGNRRKRQRLLGC